MIANKSHSVDGCKVNYIDDVYDSNVGNTTGFQYRFLDKNGKGFPILISTHAYGVIMKQIKAMIYRKETIRQIDKHIKIGDQSIKVEKIQYYGPRPIEKQNSDRDFTVTIYNEVSGESEEYTLTNKYRVSHPDRKSILKAQREKYGKRIYIKNTNREVRVNNLSQRVNEDNPMPALKNNFMDEIDNRIESIEKDIKLFEELSEKIDTLKNRLELLHNMKREFSC